MHKRLSSIILIAGLCLSGHANSQDFDYFVLALSWSPSWCTLKGEAQKAEQCDTQHKHGWTVHGLWPQYETGWPKHCKTIFRPPSRNQTNEMADIMGSGGLAWHQWKKHGSCSNLNAIDYFDQTRQAYNSINKPNVFRKLNQSITVSVDVIEQAFLRDNPQLSPDMITITCTQNYIQEARICLTKSLTPRICGADVRKDCALNNAIMPPIP